MVSCDKIGSSNYYWAFRSQAVSSREKRLNELNNEYSKLKDKLDTTELQLEQARQDQPDEADAKERDELLPLISVKTKTVCDLESQLKNLSEQDPEVLNSKAIEAQAFKDQANVSTDDIFAIMAWIKNKNPSCEEAQVFEQIDAPADLDYLN